MSTRAFPSASRAQAVQPSRSRAARTDDLQHIPWLAALGPEERQHVLDELRVPTLSGTATHGVHGEAELF